MMSWPRVGRRTALAALALGVLAGVVVGLGRVETATSLESMLPADDPQLVEYRRVAAEFGGDPIVVLLESEDGDGGYLTPERLVQTLRLEGQLAALPDVAGVYGPATLLNQLAGRAQDLLAELSGRRDAEIALARAQAQEDGLAKRQVDRAGERARARFDARYGPLIVAGLPGGLPTLSNASFVEKVVFGAAGSPRGQWRFVVPGRNSAAILVRPDEGIDARRARALVRRVTNAVDESGIGATPTISGVPVLISGISDRAVSDAPLLGGAAVLAVGACLWMAVWLRRSRRLVPLATTTVAVSGSLAVAGWLGIPISLGVIAFAPVLLGIGCYYPTYLATRAPARTVVVVATATAASLLTLALSPLPLVRDLGIVLAIGVLLSVAVVLPLRRWLASGISESALERDVAPAPGRQRRLRVALVLVAGLAATGWVALPGIPIDSDVEHFAGGLPELTDARHVEDVIGSSGQLAVLLKGDDVLAPEAMAWMRGSLESLVTIHGDELRPVLSPPALLEFLGDTATREQVDAGWRLLPPYLTQAAASTDRHRALMTFGVRVENLAKVDALRSAFLHELPQPPTGYSVEVVGLPMVLLQGEEAISADRVSGNIVGIAAAGLVLLIGLRRRSDAARAALAAVIATGLGFLVIHLAGQSLNPVTVALGALTTAVGCEFTVVQAESMRRGARHLEAAVGIVALTSASGYLVLLTSQLEAVRGFGLLLTGTVVLALASSWLVVRATVAPRCPAPAAAAVARIEKELSHA